LDDDKRRLLCNLTIEGLRALFLEVINRYCDNPLHATDCATYRTSLDHLVAAFSADYVRDKCDQNGVGVDLQVPDGVTDSPASASHLFFSSRNFAASNGGQVVYSAAHDSDANGGTFTAQDAGPGNGAGTIAPSVFLLFALLVGVLF